MKNLLSSSAFLIVNKKLNQEAEEKLAQARKAGL